MVNSDSSSGFLMQVCVISPVISWLLTPGRFSKRRGFLYAVGFLVTLAAVTIVRGMDFRAQESNFYHVMGVGRDSAYSDIKRAFRSRSVDLHPDKNPSPTATEDFNRLRLAFDVRPACVLGDASKRAVYDLFGEAAGEKELAVVQVEALIGALSYYAVWAVLTFVLTLSEAARDARAWSLAGGVLFFVLELNLIYGGAHLPTQFFPMMTVHEFTKVMRSAFPPFVNGCRAIGGYFYHDLARENFALGVELLKSNQVRSTGSWHLLLPSLGRCVAPFQTCDDDPFLACPLVSECFFLQAILLNMRQLQGEVASSRRRPEPTKALKPDALPAAARKRLKMEKHPSASQASPAVTAAATETAAAGEDFHTIANPEPVVQKPTGFAIPKFVYVIGVYLVINYVFSD
ncbi:hypothetical protein BBJ28_00022155 [Nothophytophthora sp. Chile5]|nr:hypothetical protein BBJ28_00022155 [Nothophytophthora sp. Chile5]